MTDTPATISQEELTHFFSKIESNLGYAQSENLKRVLKIAFKESLEGLSNGGPAVLLNALVDSKLLK